MWTQHGPHGLQARLVGIGLFGSWPTTDLLIQFKFFLGRLLFGRTPLSFQSFQFRYQILRAVLWDATMTYEDNPFIESFMSFFSYG